MSTYDLPGAILGTGKQMGEQVGKAACFHGPYILVEGGTNDKEET